VSNWAKTFSQTRYLKAVFPADLPSGATVTAASLIHTYRDSTGSATVCYYVATFTGTTQLGTHGSTTSPYCNAGSAYVTDTISLPEVNTGTLANGLIVYLPIWDSGNSTRRSQHDQISLSLTYYLN